MNDILYSREEMVNTLKVISSQHSPKIFLPFLLTVIPCLVLAVFTFGVSLIFTGFVWIVLDNYILKFLTTGKHSFKNYFKWDKIVLKYFYVSIIRRLMIILSFACFIIPCFIIAPALSLLPFVIDRHSDINNPFTLIKMAFDLARVNIKQLIVINLTTAYIYFLIFISFGIVSPWAVPYLKMLKCRLYCISKNIEINPDLLPKEEFGEEILPCANYDYTGVNYENEDEDIVQ